MKERQREIPPASLSFEVYPWNQDVMMMHSVHCVSQ